METGEAEILAAGGKEMNLKEISDEELVDDVNDYDQYNKEEL